MINLALIGVGKWGKNYLTTANSIPNLKIKYLCSPSINQQIFDKDYIKIKNYKKLLDYQDLDGVIISTPAITHYKIVSFFTKNGKNLLIEKPFVTSLYQAKKIEKILKKSKSKLMVGHIQLYNPAYEKVKQLVRSISPIKSISFEGFGSPPRTDVSILWDWGPHLVSLALDLLDEKPLKISAKTNISKKIYSQIAAKLYFKNTIVDMNIDWLKKEVKRSFTINGSKGVIIFDDRVSKKIKLIKNNKAIYPKYRLTPPLKKQILVFLNLITKNTQTKTDINQAMTVTKILDLLEKSAKKNGKLLNFFSN